MNNGKEQIEHIDCNEMSSGSRNFPNGFTSLDNLDYSEWEETSPETRDIVKVGGNYGRPSSFESQYSDSQQPPTGERSLTLSVQEALDDSNPSKTDSSPLNGQLEHSPNISIHAFDHMRSRDTVETTEPFDYGVISEEFSGTLRDISKSPTRSSHAYDGSVSSYDVWDDQCPDRSPHLPESNLFGTKSCLELFSTKGRPTREDVFLYQKMRNNSDVQHQEKSSSNEMHGLDVMGNFNWDKDELQEPVRHGIGAQDDLNPQESEGFHALQNCRSEKEDDFLSRDSYRRRSPVFYGNGSSSNYGHEAFVRSSSLYSSGKLEYLDQIELLRKVNELIDQLNRSYNPREKLRGRVMARCSKQENHQPLLYYYEKPDAESLQFNDAKYPQNLPGPYKPTNRGHKNYAFPQIPFSGMATHRQYHVDCSCSRCFPEDRQCLTELPPSSMCYNKGPWGGHHGIRCCSPYGSTSSSQQQHMDSNFHLHSFNTLSCEQNHMDHEVQKPYYRERPRSVKRHCRPIAGGAPFIVCHSCWKLLQIPADFLLLRKRYHQLQCGACAKILKFSLYKRGPIIPCTSSQTVPSTNEVGSNRDSTSRRNFTSASHSHEYPPADPVSYSEEYGLSICKSFSTEGEPAFMPPLFPVLQGNRSVKMDPSSSCPEPMEERKMLNLKGSKNKNSGASTYSTQSSNVAKMEKLALEAEVVSTVSPLHQLMGYSSPSEMIYRTSAVSED
nr:TPA_asm: hypothetical protein HUJ06_012922 [Nelumbo nucifera]